MAMTARFRSFSFICITSCFILLGLTRLAISEICTAPVATPDWGLAYSAVYATQTAAAAACSAMLPTLSGISHSDCVYAGSPYFYYFIDDYTNHSHYKFGHCACESSNSDGQCDSSVDTDGDGIPDDQDPCPQNPNPNCTDPNNPPSDLPPEPEFPDEIIIGDCVIDISEITSIFKAEGGVFPINWIVAFGSALRAFTQFQSSAAPSFQYSFSFFGHSYEIDLHLERFDSIASFVRIISGLLAMFYFIRFANRGFFKVITGSGT